jgi:hypothetical protein
MRELKPEGDIYFGNDKLRIEAVDNPDDGGASHHYRIFCPLTPEWHAWTVDLRFQSRPLSEVGCNGITNEALIAVLVDRLKGFQQGPNACYQNGMAILMLEEAAHWLNARTKDRVDRGVEGTTQA